VRNLLHRIPNIVQLPFDANANNNVDDDKTTLQQRHHGNNNNDESPSSGGLARQSIPENEDAAEENRAGGGGTSSRPSPQRMAQEHILSAHDVDVVVVHRDKDGGYVNAAADVDVAAETGAATDADRTAAHGDASNVANTAATSPNSNGNAASTDSSAGRRLVRQKQVVGENGDGVEVPADADDPASGRGDAAQSNKMTPSSSDEELTAHTTLQRFLEMIQNRPAGDPSNGGNKETNTQPVR
jgi:hypothetical protein